MFDTFSIMTVISVSFGSLDGNGAPPFCSRAATSKASAKLKMIRDDKAICEAWLVRARF